MGPILLIKSQTISIRLSVVVLMLLTGITGSGTAYGWYNTAWHYRQKITIDGTKVSGTLTNFPVLITESNVHANVWLHAQTNGQDILFVQEDDATRLSHEIETYNTNTQQLAIWVKIPYLGADTGRVVRMYYGNASAGDQQNATSVWDNCYNGVWHMQGVSPTNYDSSQSNNHAVVQLPGCTETGNVVISDCDTTNDWSVSAGALTTMANIRKQGTACIVWIVDTVTAGMTNTITYQPAESMNLGNRNLTYWWKNSLYKSTNFIIKLWLYDTNGNYRCRTNLIYTSDDKFRFRLDDQRILAISSGDVHSAVAPDLSAIDRVVWEFISKTDNTFSNTFDMVCADGGPERNVAGKVNGAAWFDNTNDWYRLPKLSYPSNSTTTISAWIKMSRSYGGVILHGCGASAYYSTSAGIDLGANNDMASYTQCRPRFHIGYYTNTSQYLCGDTIADWSNWHYIVGVSDDANSYLYLDNVLLAQTNLTVGGAQGSYANWENQTVIGGSTRYVYEGLFGAFPGIIDEIQCSSTARSTDWIAACYTNQGAPAAFSTSAGEEPLPSALPSGTVVIIR